MSRIQRHLTYANVMATVAVVLAMGGASYAAITLPRNSVGTKQLRNGAVTSTKLSHAVRRRAFGKGRRGPTGPVGPPGSALAFARIGPTGSISQSKAVSGVTVIDSNGTVEFTSTASPVRFSGGVAGPLTYCLQVRVPVSNIVVTPDAVNDTSTQAPDLAGAVGAISKCPAGFTSASVTVRGRPGATPTGIADYEAAFFVALN